ncbi:MAG: hypothetical protein ACQEXJ_14420 [Myxococcota bacterium]
MERFDVGHVLGRAFSVYGENFASFTALVTLVFLPVILLATAVGAEQMAGGTPNPGAVAGIGLLTLFLYPLAMAAVTYGVVQSLRGTPAAFGDCLRVGFSRLLPVIGTAILMGLAVVGGFLLLVVPGFIVMTMLYVAVPGAVVEGLGPGDAMRRSTALTSGFRWPIFGVVLVIAVLTNVPDTILQKTLGSDPDTMALYLTLSTIIGVIGTTLGSVAAAVAYHDLRAIKEGADVERLAAVFD